MVSHGPLSPISPIEPVRAAGLGRAQSSRFAEAGPPFGERPTMCISYRGSTADAQGYPRPYAVTPIRLFARSGLRVLGQSDLFSDGRKHIFDSLAVREIDHKGW